MQSTTTTLDPNAAHALALLGPVFFIVAMVFIAIYIIPIWQIVKKAGFHPALSLLIFLPVVNLVMLYVFAFSRWKVVPAPDYPVAYPPQVPPAAYPPVYPQGTTPATTNYSAPGAYAPAPPAAYPATSTPAAYPPPPAEPPTQI